MKIKYRRVTAYKYEVMETFEICLPELDEHYYIEDDYYSLQSRILTVKAHYMWNGANVIPDHDEVMFASCIHDVLCQAIREKYLPKELKDKVDRILQRLCIEAGLAKWRAWIIYWGVRIGGGSSIKNGKEQQDIVLETKHSGQAAEGKVRNE